MYCLSKTETNVVSHLIAGEAITDLVQSVGIKEQTARNHLKTILLKTKTKNERELVTLIISSLIRLKQGPL